jgi:hypothetical protein
MMNLSRARWAVAAMAVTLLLSTTPVTAQSREWCGEITSNTVWSGGQSHQVCSAGVRVRNSTLTIQPGADILMGEGASVIVEAGAKMEAVGDLSMRVRFRANTRDERPGFWGQIRFEPGSGPNRMHYVAASSGGKDNAPMIEVRDSVLELGVTPQNPENIPGIDLKGALDVPLAFSANTLGPSLEGAGNITFGGACRNIAMSGNGVNAIGVLGDAALDVTDTQTWHNFCLPYRVTEPIAVGGEVVGDESVAPELALDLGVTVQLEGAGGFIVGPDAAHPGALTTNGTPDKPILLTAASKTPGAWRGIEFTEHSAFSSLSSTRIEYGGRDDVPMVRVMSDAVVTLGGTSFHHAKAYPLELVPQAVDPFLTGVYHETERVEQPFTGNGIQRVKVLASVAPVIDQTATWGDAGVPLEIDGDLFVGGTDAQLFLDPGAQLVFAPGRVLSVGERSRGAGEITAIGTAARPVVLSGLTDTPGSWVGVRLGELAGDATFDHTVFAYGGAGDVPMVDWTRVKRGTGDVTRCTFRGASGYPLAVPLTLAHDLILAPELGDGDEGVDLRSTFEGNGSNRVRVTVDSTLAAVVINWNDPGAPVEIDGLAKITSASTPLLNLHSGLRLVFPPGGGLQLGDGGAGKASLVISAAAADDPVVSLGAVDPATGWAGVKVLAGSAIEAPGWLTLSGVAADAAAIRLDNAVAHLTWVDLTGSQRGTGLEVVGAKGWASLRSVRVTGHRIGLYAHDGGGLEITRSFVQGNTEWGLRSDNADRCLRAPLVYWGARTGPRDESASADDCMNAANASPTGDRVSDHVDWWPYALDAEFRPSPGLGPNPKKAYLPVAKTGR